MASFEETTRHVRVVVEPMFLPEQSEPEHRQFIWAYRVQIENHGGATVQLLERTWRITDAVGRMETVHGEGVVGEQPVLKPGDTFQYTSGTQVATPSGIMSGAYHMVATETGERFDIAIPPFSLDSPHERSRLN